MNKDYETTAVAELMHNGEVMVGVENVRVFNMPSGNGAVIWLKSAKDANDLYLALEQALKPKKQ